MRAIRSDFLITLTKCAFKKEGSGIQFRQAPSESQLDQASIVPNGTIRTESARSLKLRLSSRENHHRVLLASGNWPPDVSTPRLQYGN